MQDSEPITSQYVMAAASSALIYYSLTLDPSKPGLTCPSVLH